MCFGGSKSKPVVAPPPSPPTTFDYSVANRGQERQQQVATAAAPSAQAASFGSELSGVPAAPVATGGM